ncbi:MULTISPECIES: hypothetical protein [Streptacidiphilus]|uniref:PE-PGRS family protein n=1 Tax=Streptacidiphilus cavernicola TaxID=3342716 RepID=A0ABV6UV34_9ACTN|nr:hypothetical protein [Streptacidiphilus jeojiense]
MHLRGSGSSFEGPRDIWRELAESDLRSLGRRSFRVYGPIAPLLDSPALSSWEQHNGRLAVVVLSHGALFDPDGPYVQVETHVEEEGLSLYPLQDVVEDERDRLFTHAGIDEGAGTDPAEESEPWFTVDGIPVRARLRVEGKLWAARFSVGGPDSPLRGRGGDPVVLTLTGRGIAPERVALRTVEELQPYALGRQALLQAVAERRGTPQPHISERELPQAQGLEAHRRLIDFSVQDALRFEASMESGHKPRTPRGTSGHAELWESAVRQQMRLAGEDRAQADEAVGILVNQMTRLAFRADWFPGTDDARAAVEESIRYAVFDSDVPSAGAQRAWRIRFRWDPSAIAEAATEQERRRLLEQRLAVEADWLDQWNSWLMERSESGS